MALLDELLHFLVAGVGLHSKPQIVVAYHVVVRLGGRLQLFLLLQASVGAVALDGRGLSSILLLKNGSIIHKRGI